MSAQFAGSSSVDQRRRRRLAQESSDEISTSPDKLHSSPADSHESDAALRLPDESLIPRSPWKIAGLALAGLLAWGSMLGLGIAQWPKEIGIGPLVDLQQGRLSHFFTTVCLVLSAQLSFLIYWYRSNSRKDFKGRYRLWGWAGIFWAITCTALATELYLPAAKVVLERYPLPFWRPETLYWLTPYAIGFLALYRILGPELRQSAFTETGWIAALWLGIIAGGLQIGLELLIPQYLRVPISIGLVTFWHYVLVVTLLVQARYVVHVSNEAAPKCPSFSRRLVRAWFAGITGLVRRICQWRNASMSAKSFRREARLLRKAELQTEAEKPGRKSASEDSTPDKAEAKRPSKVTKKRVLGNNLRRDPAESKPAPHREMEAVQRPAPPVKAAASRASEVDNEEDLPVPSGPARKLSKAEKRQQRQERRQARRREASPH